MVIPWPAGAEAALTLSFDDGYVATFAATVFSLRQWGLCGTYHVVTGRAGAHLDGLATAGWAEWREAARLGHEIASHGAFHAPLAGALSDAGRLLANLRAAPDRRAYTRQLLSTRRALRRWHDPASAQPEGRPARPSVADLASSRQCIDREVGGAESIAYPAGRQSAAARRAVAAAGFHSARALGLGLNDALSGLFALRSVALGPGMVVQDLVAWLDRARASNAWLVAVFHLVADANPAGYPYFCSTSDWRQLLDAVQSRPLWVATQREVVRHLSTVVKSGPGSGE
jgi:peptidoglycan/xylan/chitin deacetylase (PgdA/CDA1 family)